MNTNQKEETARQLDNMAAVMFWDRECPGLMGDLNRIGFSAEDDSDPRGSFIILNEFFGNSDSLMIGKDITGKHDFGGDFKLGAWRYGTGENSYRKTEDMTPECGIAANRQAVLSFIINAIKEI